MTIHIVFTENNAMQCLDDILETHDTVCLQVETTLRVGEASVTVDRKMGRHIQQLSRLPGYLAAVISFKTQQVMLGNTWNKMIAVFAIGIPACIAGGAAYSLASGRDILTGFIQAYGALYKIPGDHFARFVHFAHFVQHDGLVCGAYYVSKKKRKVHAFQQS